VAVYQDKAFAVCLDAATQRAPEFASAVEIRQGEPFELPVSRSAFKQFIQACEGKTFTVTRATCYDSFFLARHYYAQEILNSLIDCVKNDPVELAASALRFAHEFNEPPSADFERLLAAHFLSCELDDLKGFHVSILERIIQFPQSSEQERFQSVFDRVVELHRAGVPGIAVLFRGVNRFRLSEHQTMLLNSLDGFLWEFLDHSDIAPVVTNLTNLPSANAQLNPGLDELEQDRVQDVENRRRKKARSRRRLDELEQDRVQDVENRRRKKAHSRRRLDEAGRRRAQNLAARKEAEQCDRMIAFMILVTVLILSLGPSLAGAVLNPYL
jgi:hypothetical protein